MELTDHYVFQFPEVKKIFVGGCVARGEGSSFRAKAHAHIEGPHKGCICVRKMSRTSCLPLMLHEAAHLITGQGHTDKWRKKLIEIGGTLDEVNGPDGNVLRSYHKEVRKPK